MRQQVFRGGPVLAFQRHIQRGVAADLAFVVHVLAGLQEQFEQFDAAVAGSREQQPRAIGVHVVAIRAGRQQAARDIGGTGGYRDAQCGDAVAARTRIDARMGIEQALHGFGDGHWPPRTSAPTRLVR